MDRLILDSPIDMHLHLRDGDMLNRVIAFSATNFSAAVVMPNISPPIKSAKDMLEYKDRILQSCNRSDFRPLMTLYLHKDICIEEIKEAQNHNLHGVKLYPFGVTTNSEDGAKSIFTRNNEEVFEYMQSRNIPLLIHGESSGFCLDREGEFLMIFEEIAKKYPKLKVVAEHITTEKVAKAIKHIPNLYGTITLHHLLITLDDVIGGSLNPHNFCKPIAKRYEDRDALLELALSAYEKVCFGSDSAPHLKEKKECANGAAGIFSAPVLLPMLAELFEKHSALSSLQAFVSDNAKNIFNLQEIPKKEVVLVRKEFVIPDIYSDVVPFFAGESIGWSYE
ncbi:MAG: dihydroorotase [Campylobacterales bacterium]